ncbi:Serine carboxypeptidase-like 29 [Bienertia sinuspersici]
MVIKGQLFKYTYPIFVVSAEESLKFLLEWFERFPQYKGKDFFISGESYGGHYVPQLSQAIVNCNLAANKKIINLKGYMVGNALTDDFYDHLGVFQFMWSSGLISDETYKLLNEFCANDSFIHPSEKCDKVLDIADSEIGNIDPYSIYTPSCTVNSSSTLPSKLQKRLIFRRINEAYDPCTEKHSVVYFNQLEVQQALHVNPKFAPAPWETCR